MRWTEAATGAGGHEFQRNLRDMADPPGGPGGSHPIAGEHKRTCRRHIDHHEDEGLAGLADKRLPQVSQLKVPVDEVVRLETLYRKRYCGWNFHHFHWHYRHRHLTVRQNFPTTTHAALPSSADSMLLHPVATG